MPNFQYVDRADDIIPTADEITDAKNDVAMAKKIYTHIVGKNPSGYIFRVEATVRGGIAKISHPLLPPTWAYVIHLRHLQNEYGWRMVDHAVGELLERFNLPRHTYNQDLYREASAKHRLTKQGIFRREIDLKTGTSRLILPAELAA